MVISELKREKLWQSGRFSLIEKKSHRKQSQKTS